MSSPATRPATNATCSLWWLCTCNSKGAALRAGFTKDLRSEYGPLFSKIECRLRRRATDGTFFHDDFYVIELMGEFIRLHVDLCAEDFASDEKVRRGMLCSPGCQCLPLQCRCYAI